jgi:hypothetical protein
MRKKVETIGAVSELLATETMAGTTVQTSATSTKYISAISWYGATAGKRIQVRNGADEELFLVTPEETVLSGTISFSNPLMAVGGINILGTTDTTGKVAIYTLID